MFEAIIARNRKMLALLSASVSENDKFKDEILQDEFKDQNSIENDKLNEYKFFIIDMYRKNDYEIRLNPQDDENIDIIAYKAEEVLLIHCIDTPNSPKRDGVKAFIRSCDFYIKNNQKFLKNRQIRKIFITTCAQMDDETGLYLQKYNVANSAKIEYKKVEFAKEQEV